MKNQQNAQIPIFLPALVLFLCTGNIFSLETVPFEEITITNAMDKLRTLVRYTDAKQNTNIDPISSGSTVIIKRQPGTPIFYSIDDISDELFTATPDLFFGSVLTIKIPPAIQSILDRTALTKITSVGEAVAKEVVSQRPYVPPLPKQNEVVHPPLVVPPPPGEGIHYTYPGMGVQTR